ncbi:MAG TPA: glycerol kinase GlpK [Candidatus Olsenella pullistercoris]|uniref:ATP:glycerol 3-phosphotransferase n=1 Tax=Candidatus Olsenella pullistercoris TaxID=2838712 RepID=A0A9D2EYB8_9ACTN|nr:glycerol kinase GlpK [Candidatus Olsenella pullistercoris]
MRPFVLAIDQSTQGTKALLFDGEGRVAGKVSRPHEQHVDERGWVEHDPEEIMTNVLACARDVCKRVGARSGEVRAVGISNQRETCLAWDRVRREPLHRAIVWQCGRAREVCERLVVRDPDAGRRVRELSGMALSPYFSAAKMAWLLEEVPAVRAAAKVGTLALGTMDSWLVFKLCEGNPHVTEPSNACRTQLLDIRTGTWSDELCELFGVPRDALAKVMPSDSVFGRTTMGGLFPEPVPVCGVLGDSQAALAAQGCLAPGDVKATYGTGSSVMMQTGERLYESANGLVSSIAWDFSGQRSYVLEGNLNYTGAVISWLRDGMRLIESPAEVEGLIAEANPEDRAYFVPAFTGLGAPWWAPEATGLLTGVTRTTGRAEMVKACAECIPYQVADVLDALRADTGLAVRELSADGGVTANRYLMQFQADMADADVVVSDLQELSAAGAAFVAGRAAGVWSENVIYEGLNRTVFSPAIDPEVREGKRTGWRSAIRRAM